MRLLRTLHLLCLGVLVALLCACTQTLPATQVLVVVHADTEDLESKLSVLRIRLFPLGASEDSQAIERRNIALTTDAARDGKYTLPFSFGIEKVKESRFLLVITGYRREDTEPVIEHKLIASFLDRQTALIEVVLSGACYERASDCASLDQTCYPESFESIEPGSCGPVREASVRPAVPGAELDATLAPSSPMTESDGGAGASADSGDDAAEGGPDNVAPSDAAEVPVPSDAGAAASDAALGTLDAESKIDDCASDPCASFEVCSDGLRTRSCRCPLGFGGAMCLAFDPLEVAYVGETTADLAQFEAWLGRPLDGVFVSTDGMDWSDYALQRTDRIARWATLDRRVFWSIALLVPGASLAEAGSGAYDAHYRAAAEALASTRPQDAEIFVRTGSTFNLESQLWSARGKTADFIAAYRRFVTVFRAVSSRFRFEWNMALGDLGMDPATAYPGDEYVDVIGMSFHYNTAHLPTDPDQAWTIAFEQPYGLGWHQEFATAHQKRLVYSEWAVNTDSAGRFIELAKEWFESAPVLFHAYWNKDGAIMGKLSDDKYPAAGAAYKAAFGP